MPNARLHIRAARIIPALLLLGGAWGTSHAANLPTTRALTEMSLEQLADMEVTSVSKRAQPLSQAAASVYVITSDDIRRSGATSLVDTLRLAPNLQVSAVSANDFVVRARGVVNTSANKLLVMIDGRSVYSPLFSGVFWDVQDVVLEDIERIEVVSGPGGTLWGVNAVNGVINVITRSAAATQGTLLAGHAGGEGSSASVRHGAKLGDAHVRFHARYLDRRHTQTAAGAAIDDDAHLAQVGFRADREAARSRMTVLGNAYRGSIGQPRPGSISIGGVELDLAPIPVAGANLAVRWTHVLDGGSEATLQAYYDRTERTVQPTFADRLDTFDLQLLHSMTVLDAHSLVWGAQYRYSRDRVAGGELFAFLPARLDQRWGSLFAQAEASLAPSLRLIAGLRAEYNDYTGVEYLPNVRLAWTPRPEHLLWTSLARTVRGPSRLDRDAFVPGTPPFLLTGGPETRSEVASVLEGGYRGSAPGLSWSITTYRAAYDHLRTQEIAPSQTSIFFANGMEAATHGVELWGAWQPSPRWRLTAGYTAQRQSFRLKPGSNDLAAPAAEGRDPAHAWLVRSSLDLPASTSLDMTLRGAAALSNPQVPGYVTADLRFGWKPLPRLEVALVARNLAGADHGEYGPIETRTGIGRSYYVSLWWEFDRD